MLCIAKQFVTSYRDYTGVTGVADTFDVINCCVFKCWGNVTFLHCKAVCDVISRKDQCDLGLRHGDSFFVICEYSI